jgi:monoamine oxidase
MRCDVVVVGGGVAGLAAAGHLAATGRKVQLLEARSRLGGRVCTKILPENSHPVELGAEFIQGDFPEVLELVRSGGLTLREMPMQHRYSRGGREQPFPDAYSLLSRLLHQPDLPDIPVAQLIRQQIGSGYTAEDIKAMTAFLEGFHAADMEQFGVAALSENQAAEERDGESQYRLLEGYSALADLLLQRLSEGGGQVQTEAVVVRIRWRPGEVLVEAHTPRGRIEVSAPQLILTLPLPHLKDASERGGAISLIPVPRGWPEALATLHMGSARRIVLQFQDAWWMDRSRPAPSFVHGRDELLPVWWTAPRPESPFLTGWVGGAQAEALRDRTQHELERAALQSLASIFGHSVSLVQGWLTSSYSHDWSNDPYARGAYSYGGVGSIAAVRTLRTPVENTLFLAGEAVAGAGRNATVPGALISGYAAARSLVESLAS